MANEIAKIIGEINKKYEKEPAEEHKLVYDSASETLEPVYFRILDKMNDFFQGEVEKYVDNFVSSPGSGHFSELMGKATKMQEESMKALGMVNNLIKAIINLVYDLKNFQLRLFEYDKAKSKNPTESEAGILALKQIWMDNVDIKRGNTSIKGLASQFDYAMLIDSFLTAKSVSDVDKLDVNDRIKRVLKPRVLEFYEWLDKSGKELRQRYELEKTYLKSELASLKLYTRWAKPYLKAAAELEQPAAGRKPELVKAFNTILLELALIGKSSVKIDKQVNEKVLPKSYLELERRKKLRKYYSCVIVDLFFRGIPQRLQQGYVYGGRTEVTFRAYALNEEELKLLEKRFDETDVADALKLVEVTTGESLGSLEEDIKNFLEEKPKSEEAKKREKETNPFFALIGIGLKKKEEAKPAEKPVEKIKEDNFYEKPLREMAEKSAQEACFNLFDIYKKAHGMMSHPSPY